VSHLRFEHLLIKDLLEWLLRDRDPIAPLDPATGQRHLPYRRRFVVTTTVVVVIANAALGFALALSFQDLSMLLPSLGIFGLMWTAAMFGAWEVFLTRVSFGSEGITLERAGGSRALIPWGAVRGIRYSRLGSWFIIEAPGFPTVRVSIYRSGLRTFAIAADRGLAAGPLGRAPYALFEKARNP
jgi:hypothetical protein